MADTLLIDSLLDKSGTYLCVLTPEGKIVTISTRFARLVCGRNRDSLVGVKAADAVQGSVELKSFFTSLIASPGIEFPSSPLIQPVHRNAEKPVWIKFDISRGHSEKHGDCIIVSGTDVTEEVSARRYAELKAHERSSFMVRMGHELRTPLNTVLGYAQLLGSMDDLSPVAREYASTIITNENNLLHLLNDVLEFSKYEAGQTVAVVAETNIKKLVQEVTKSYIDQFNNKYLSLSVEFKGDIPDALLTDSQKVAQVLSNIIGNALKFTRKGGVSITVSCDKMVNIDVEDTGIGIDPADIPQVFDMFAQGGVGKEHMTGTGIGLTIARVFARLLGGDVVLVRSNPEKGSLFRFTFESKPVRSAHKSSLQISDYTTIKGISRPCKVLLVDDVDINLAMLEIFLAPAGFDVSIAVNGFEAVEKFRSFKPDIVFMDLIMPEKDGFEATREVKELDPAVPVVALTASIVDSVKEQALEAGVNDFLNKPFVPERFFEIIAEHTGITYTTD